MSKNKETAKSIRELDLTSAYGFAGMKMNAAKGFGVTFGENVKTQRRYKTFEYRATMYTIFKRCFLEGKAIRSVFSNYSPLGLLYIGKHALDLVIIFEDNNIHLYQFDGHFCHGDYNHQDCPSLQNYANGKCRKDCEQKTMERDEFILNWLMNTNSANTIYHVITDCCHPEYSKQNLNTVFSSYFKLQNLVSGLDRLDGGLENVDYSEVTFLAIVTGHATINMENKFGPIFVTGHDEYYQNQPTIYGGKILLTSDYYLYLKHTFGFTITSIEWIVFYKVCEDLPKVFEKIVSMRERAQSQSPKGAFLKTMVNYACGYFGLNQSKQAKMSARIAYKLPKRFNIVRDDITPIESFGQQSLMLIQSYSKQKRAKHICFTPLVLFVQIIEFGKLRLNRAIQCLQQHI